MQNPIYSMPFSSHSLVNQQFSDPQDLEDHFNNLLGESTSRYTAAETQIINSSNEQAFHSSRVFAMGTLESWGMKMGTLHYSRDNQLTIKCILQLITQKQHDIQHKKKMKEQLAAMNFQKEKYQSLLKQTKNTLAQKDKQLGKVENQFAQLRKKLKLLENQSKKQKADDQKMIFMLKSKNQQILHQIKKKQAEVNRIKEQMKRNVLSKSTPQVKSQNGFNLNSNQTKNSFELIEKIERQNSAKQSKWKKNATQRKMNQNYGQNFQEEKFTLMLQKYEKEKKLIMNENTLLRGKVFQIREVLVKFAEWIDVELFGQTLEQTRKLFEKKFICNHNLLFSQDALMTDLLEVISEAKNGIQQLQQRLQQTQTFGPSQKSIESPTKNSKQSSFNGHSSKSINIESNLVFKKKSVSIRETGTPLRSNPFNVKPQKVINTGRESQKQIKPQKRQTQKASQNQKLHKPNTNLSSAAKSPQIQKQIFLQQEYGSITSLPSEIRPSKSLLINELQLSAFENDILSEIYENSATEDPDNSIISHISASEFVKQVQKCGKGKYDKWDILFKTQGDGEEEGEQFKDKRQNI